MAGFPTIAIRLKSNPIPAIHIPVVPLILPITFDRFPIANRTIPAIHLRSRSIPAIRIPAIPGE